VAEPKRTRAGSLLPLALAALALLAAGCDAGDDDPVTAAAEPGGAVAPLGEETAGSVAQLAQCRDWNRGDEAEKLATIDDIRSQVNLQDSGFDAPPLSDDEAMQLFDNACSPSFAQGFRLYILYARGAAAAPLAREAPAGD
jgi:hypothetical protein